MMLNRGAADGRRYLSESSVEAMTQTQTGDLKTGFTDGMSFGLGWGVVRQPQGVTERLSPGSFGVRIEPLDGTVPALIPAAINARVLEIAQTNFTAEWWTSGDDGLDDPTALSPIALSAGQTVTGRNVVTTIDATATSRAIHRASPV